MKDVRFDGLRSDRREHRFDIAPRRRANLGCGHRGMQDQLEAIRSSKTERDLPTDR
jgi:hypothetical protein